jgi:C-terminal processing protease CtpA/Prc
MLHGARAQGAFCPNRGRGHSGSDIEAGSELVSINGNDIKDITAEMLRRIPADGDNQSAKYYKLNNWFSYLYPDLIDAADTYALEVKPEGADEVVSYDLDPATMSADQQQEGNEPVPTGDFKEDYATLTVGSFNFYDDAGITAFKQSVDTFFSSLKEKETENLILDLRNNWGGEPTVSAYLLTHLISEPVVYFDSEGGGGLYYDALTKPMAVADNAFHGSLYVLVNGASYSSTGHFASLLDYHNIGTFIGQETGGGYLCTDDTSSLTLENTGLVLYSSRRVFKTAVEGMVLGRGILPDYETTPTVADYMNGVDLEMDKALELMGGG